MDEDFPTLNGGTERKFITGTPITEGGYRISYNDDGAGYFYIRYEGEVHSTTYSFQEVEMIGEHSYNCKCIGKPTGFYLKDIQNYPLLQKTLNTIIEIQSSLR